MGSLDLGPCFVFGAVSGRFGYLSPLLFSLGEVSGPEVGRGESLVCCWGFALVLVIRVGVERGGREISELRCRGVALECWD